jgi:cell division protease FtsH
MGGPERRSRLMNAKEKEVVAYHEAGHAVVSYLCANSDPVQKVTIVPRGQAGGYVWRVSDRDRVMANRSYFEDNIAVALGGRVAEELIFGDISNGASMDIQQLTQMTRAMVTKYGMSDKMGPLQFGQQDEMVFLGRELAEQRDYSEEVAEQIDEEVRRIVTASLTRVRKLLGDNLDKLHIVAKALLENETLNREEFEEIFVAAPA